MCRLTCQAHFARFLGDSANALDSTRRSGRRGNPAALLYDDWFARRGERARNANSPISGGVAFSTPT